MTPKDKRTAEYGRPKGIRFLKADWEKICSIAKKKGLAASTWIRTVILERINREGD